MKNIKSIPLLILLSWLTLSLTAQQNTGVEVEYSDDDIAAPQDKVQQRALAAKLLIEHDKTPMATNNNNTRSNKDKCCQISIPVPRDYQVLAFGLSSTWYVFQEGVGDVAIPNPIPYLHNISPNWEVALYDDNVEIISNKAVFIQGNELLLSIDGLPDGRYFIELVHEENLYATGFTIGDALPTAPTGDNQPMTENIVALSEANNKKRAVAAKLLVELDNIPKANNRNNGRCCGICKCPIPDKIIYVPTDNVILTIGVTTDWYLFIDENTNQIIPNPIPYLASIKSNWDAAIYSYDEGFLFNKTVFVQNNELLLSLNGLPDGTYFIEIEHNGDYYATGFSNMESAGPIVPASTSPRH